MKSQITKQSDNEISMLPIWLGIGIWFCALVVITAFVFNRYCPVLCSGQ